MTTILKRGRGQAAAIAAFALCALAPSATVAQAAEIGVVGELNTTGAGAVGRIGSISVDPNTGDVYLTDPENHRVMKYDAAGNFVLTFGREVNRTKVNQAGTTAAEQNVCTASSGDECQPGTEGVGPGQFALCAGVAVDPTDDDVYVTNTPDFSSENGAVERFDPNGSYISEIQSGVGGAPQMRIGFTNPLAVDLIGNLYVANISSAEPGIFKFNSSGSYLGLVNNGPLYYDYENLAVDQDGALYTSSASREDLKFGPAGLLLFIFQQYEFEEGIQRLPGLTTSLATGDFFNLIVHYEHHLPTEETEVVEYNPRGTEVHSYPTFGADSATKLAFDAARGRLYETREQHVLIYGPFPVPTPQAPSVSDEGSSDYDLNSVSVEARVDPHLVNTTYAFEYGTDPSLAGATSVPAVPRDVGAGYLPVGVKAELGGLRQSTTYYYRVVAHSAFGGGAGSTVPGPVSAFTTLAPRPSVVTEGASEVGFDAATLNGIVRPGSVGAASDAKWCFEYGRAGSSEYNLGSLPLRPEDAGEGDASVPVSLHLTRLEPGSTYRYRLVAVNSLGLGQGSSACGVEDGQEADGAEGLFTTSTSLPAPVAVSGAASGVSPNGATISGIVEAHGLRTSYEFQIGLDTGYGAQVFGEAGADVEPRQVSLALGSLQPGTTYHYRLVAISQAGTSYGADATFTTSTFPSAALSAPATAPLVATPSFEFPATVTVSGKPGVGTKKRKSRRAGAKARKKTVRRHGKAARGARRAGHSRDGRAGR
jgi:hypothetical protein